MEWAIDDDATFRVAKGTMISQLIYHDPGLKSHSCITAGRKVASCLL
jgi:hypothetical protein